MFRTSVPVTAEAFFDREDDLRQLGEAVSSLLAGAPKWLCILGTRKVGKTSLLLELSRRTLDPSVVFAIFDVFEVSPLSLEVFRSYALRVVDATFGPELGVSLEALSTQPAAFRRALQESDRFVALPSAVRNDVLELPDRTMDDAYLRACIELPERIAHALKLRVLCAIDEFQELAGLSVRGKQGALMPLLRSLWQRHREVAYVISGSARRLLLSLVTDERSPFFQHFALMEIGPLPPKEAIRLLTTCAPEGRPIPADLAARAVELLTGHPFYLQLFGDTLTTTMPPYDETSLKAALQVLLFSQTGRLALYFEREFDLLVGRSTHLAATLEALSEGPRRLNEMAHALGVASGAAVRYIERLGDVVVRTDDDTDPGAPARKVRERGGRYKLADPTFALWLRWRRPGGTVVPMKLIGDQAEQEVAEHLALAGFELVYQSRASRGAFDLMATRGIHQLGLQVKRTHLPVRFSAAEWDRMVADGKRLGWHWVVAVVAPPPDRRLLLLDPRKATSTARGVTLGEAAAIKNILLWLDAKAKKRRGASRAR